MEEGSCAVYLCRALARRSEGLHVSLLSAKVSLLRIRKCS